MKEDGNANEHELLDRTLLTEGDFVPQDDNIDLTNCDKEPIHIPGRIQPHGVLVAVTREDGCRIGTCSANTEEMLGIAAGKLLGTPLADLIGEERVRELLSLDLRASSTSELQHVKIEIEVRGVLTPFYGIAHESEGLLILEMEPSGEDSGPAARDYRWISLFFGRIKQTQSRVEASHAAAELVREMLGYDRVMIYEFDKEWNGKVIAESREPDMEPFLGHHYPASDIPRQARELYLRNWLRTIVDAGYKPVDIIPAGHPLTGKPLNLSLSVLRSVSPLHIEYLQNMGVGATTTISLIHGSELWGLITCHHRSPKYVPHRIRSLCNFLGAFFSNELYQRQQLDDYSEALRLKTSASLLSSILIGVQDPLRLHQRLEKEKDSLLGLMSATGAAVSFRGQLMLFGDAPLPSHVRELAEWLEKQSVDYTYHTSRLSKEFGPAAAYREKASGALFLSLSPDMREYIIWFRPELIQVVDWAGDPAKSVIRTDDGIRLSPRKSFEKWRQVVQGTSAPWKLSQLSALPELKAVALRHAEEQLARAEEQAEQNARVMRENEERYLQLMEYSPVPFLTVTGGRIVYGNHQAMRLLGFDSASEIRGASLIEALGPENPAELLAALERLEQNPLQLETCRGRFRAGGGALRLLDLTFATVVHSRQPSMMVIARESSSLPETDLFTDAQDQLQMYMTTDPLTDMQNLPSFEQSLKLDWEQSLLSGRPVALLLIDIDDFRTYNKLQGLRSGDVCLQWVGDALSVLADRSEANIARLTGGTFVMKLEAEEAEALLLAEQIRTNVISLQIPRDPSQAGGFITVSIGISVKLADSSLEGGVLMKEAREALVQAKNDGKNRIRVAGR
ncbi:diguanylate cyclase domain-containing protein [Paenibacillus sp. P22]|uniref:diguanylate cyclase domain-containing protein n=1 Tax=Paenibacillus sp. P22 TaxID=483908 RepID=UPI00038F9091|nr:diguanylate cyclase [Paenibacillus sp. P22]CDN45725.1 Putative phytochrome-like protein Cph1 [Paenibacillus sp. P22]